VLGEWMMVNVQVASIAPTAPSPGGNGSCT
jgi:hypothetical protein